MRYADEFLALTGVPMTPEQERSARSIQDVEKAVQYLEVQLGKIMKMISEHLGVPVLASDIAHGVVANDRIYKASRTAIPRIVAGIPAERLIELGRDAVYNEAAKMHWIVALYVEREGRVPDPDGFKVWLNLLAAGHAADTVREWIINGFE